MSAPDDPLDPTTSTLLAAGGAAWIASAFLPWVHRGAGSVLSLRDVGDLLLAARWASIPRWVGVLAYVVPLCGGVALITAGLGRATARRLAAAWLVVSATVLLAAGITMVVKGRFPGIGLGAAVAGVALVGTGRLRLRA